MNQFSVTQWIFGNEPLKDSCRRLQALGYDGIELAGEPDTMDLKETAALLQQHNLSCTSICGIYTPDRNLSSPHPETAQSAIRYLTACTDMAANLGAPYVIVVPGSVGKTAFEGRETFDSCWNNAVKNIRTAAAYAASRNITFVIEAVNRYETCLVYNLPLALRMAEEIGCPNVRLMADLFHMNLEERDICDALSLISPYLCHVHFADNTREAPGYGHTDFSSVIRLLKNIHYHGAYTMEFLPAISDPYEAAKASDAGASMEQAAYDALHYLKRLCAG